MGVCGDEPEPEQLRIDSELSADGRDEDTAQFFCLIYIVSAAVLMLSAFSTPVANFLAWD